MANFETTEELKLGALKLAGELEDGTSDYDDDVLEHMNNLYRSIYAGSNEFEVSLGDVWQWARSENPGTLTLLSPYETGTVSLTNASTSGTFSSAPSASLGSFKGYRLYLTGQHSIYIIDSHTAGSVSFILNTACVETTGSYSFKAIKLQYELTSGIQRLAESMRTHRRQWNEDPDGQISMLEAARFNHEFPLQFISSGVPTRFCIIRELDGQFTVQFNRYPLEQTIIEYDYIPQASELRIVTFLDAAVNTTTEVITSTAHGFKNRDIVRLSNSGGALPSGLSINTNYYIISATADTFKLSATLDGSAVDITAAAGGGTHKIQTIPRMPRSFRKALMYAAVHFVMIDKSDSRADYYMRQTQAVLQALLVDNRRVKQQTAKNSGRLIARLDDFRDFRPSSTRDEGL